MVLVKVILKDTEYNLKQLKFLSSSPLKLIF
jgi:hypothetical protein